MIKTRIFISICILMFGLILFVSGCSTETPVPIDRITVMKEPSDHRLPTGYFGPLPEEPIPQSGAVGAPYHPGDKIFIILSVNENLKDAVTFSRFTFYDQQTREEVDLPLPEVLEPFTPGQIFTVAFDDYWTVPDEPGNYELRVYVGEQEAISATFTVA